MRALKIIGIIAVTIVTVVASCAYTVRRGFKAKEYAQVPFPIN